MLIATISTISIAKMATRASSAIHPLQSSERIDWDGLAGSSLVAATLGLDPDAQNLPGRCTGTCAIIANGRNT
jgi:hypothetical protein